MRFVHFLSLVLSFTCIATALLRGSDLETVETRVARARLARYVPESISDKASRGSIRRATLAAQAHVKNFAVSDIYTTDFFSSQTAWNRTITFLFADNNSNTSTICTKSWTQSNTTNNYPTSYVLCDFTADNSDVFYFKFDTMTSLGNFTLELAHEFSDPVNYPPPYDVVEYFSAPTKFTLPCDAKTTTSGVFTNCVTAGPTTVIVSGIAN
ncbi:hypothetical protein BP5796_11647 [Coleophoma crateriformis]|uniref:AA1-like domain-containing protein n=1 Tax=Coleophoma crateriformis TaxID=565419 RepID=A0A3D8QEA8_9HELO|nr:hypothetical protein BP5796_11647 [Coleophoma crateriformis]